MSYTPTQWQTGDTITAAGLNKMENGIENANNPFIVILTPTALDYSGTMDKTVGEINAAYEAGRRIVFQVYTSATSYAEVECIIRGRNMSAGDYPSFNAYVIDEIDEQNSVLVYAYTGVAAVASTNTYSTIIYPLTPMS